MPINVKPEKISNLFNNILIPDFPHDKKGAIAISRINGIRIGAKVLL